eukprot:2088352-Prymnesium_polylepis.1
MYFSPVCVLRVYGDGGRAQARVRGRANDATVCYGSTGTADACVTGLRGRWTRTGHACGDVQTTDAHSATRDRV